MDDLLVGVDAGGTRTRVTVFRHTFELARGEGPSGAVRGGRVLSAANAISATVREVLARVGATRAASLVVGAAGVAREPERGDLAAALRAEQLADRVRVVSDVELALAAAFGEGPGVLLIAGTGSIAVARAADGRLHRSGGLGWQIGDEGSGYWLGRAALVAVGHAADGRGPDTALAGAILTAIRGETLDELVRWAGQAGVSEVAALAPSVLACAAHGDAVAGAIVTEGANALVELVQGVRHQVPGAAVACTGGLLREGALASAVRERLQQAGMTVMPGVRDATEGALVLGVER